MQEKVFFERSLIDIDIEFLWYKMNNMNDEMNGMYSQVLVTDDDQNSQCDQN